MDKLYELIGASMFIEGEELRCYDIEVEDNNYVSFWVRRLTDIDYKPMVFLIAHLNVTLIKELLTRCSEEQGIDELGTLYEFDEWEHGTTFLELTLEKLS